MQPISRRSLLLAAASSAVILPGVARAGLFSKDGPIFTKRGLAIRGADPVAFFTDGAPVIGDTSIATDWMGATWTFASADNRTAFESNPHAFAPQYGGYCAFAVSRGYTASTVPEAWSIEGDKLYLNYSVGVRGQWLQDVPGNIAAGDENWPGLLADLTA